MRTFFPLKITTVAILVTEIGLDAFEVGEVRVAQGESDFAAANENIGQFGAHLGSAGMSGMRTARQVFNNS